MQQQQVIYLHGFLVEQRGCGNLNLAVLSQTDENNTVFSHRQTASWNSHRRSPVHVSGKKNNPNSQINKQLVIYILYDVVHYKHIIKQKMPN